ncbi:hypothetical protein [Hyphomonas sp.]|uniref:hypothetical protein n=1 Tax=Hyphomonas sp. TaxID=87 RepID=UPI0025B97F41|nr:hypothetical protein [Hyphomonas sp.]
MLNTATIPATIPVVTIIDQPCGSGKTSRLIATFRPDRQYLVVVPLLTEVERVLADAKVPFSQPSEEQGNKYCSILDLLSEGKNIVTTHALYTELATAAELGLLQNYDTIVDEVLDVVHDAGLKSTVSWLRVYVDCGWATVDGDGRCWPTAKWSAEVNEVKDTLDPRLYAAAKAGCLFLVDNTFLLWALPPILFTSGRSMTVLTYLAEGSTLLAYLRKRGIPFRRQYDAAKDLAFRLRAKDLITVRTISALEKDNWSYSGQTLGTGRTARVERISEALSTFRKRSLKGVPLNNVMVTSAKSNWYAKGHDASSRKPKAAGFASRSKLFKGTHWVANTTRGTNSYIHCTHAVYLWDQHPNVFIQRWLGLGGCRAFAERYATTELIQWLYRTQVRRGLPVTVYLPSPRMRRLLNAWLNAEDILQERGGLQLAA